MIVAAPVPGPRFPVGSRVRVKVKHMEGHKVGEVREAALTYAYGIMFDGSDEVHKWYVESELELESASRSSRAVERISSKETTSKSTESQVRVFVHVSKVDEELGVVFGWASVTEVDGVPLVDFQKDVIPTEVLERAVYEFMLADRFDEMHTVPARGHIVESVMVTDDKLAAMFPGQPLPQGPRGWWIGVKPDPDLLEKFKRGEYRGFSIAGWAEKEGVRL